MGTRVVVVWGRCHCCWGAGRHRLRLQTDDDVHDGVWEAVELPHRMTRKIGHWYCVLRGPRSVALARMSPPVEKTASGGVPPPPRGTVALLRSGPLHWQRIDGCLAFSVAHLGHFQYEGATTTHRGRDVVYRSGALHHHHQLPTHCCVEIVMMRPTIRLGNNRPTTTLLRSPWPYCDVDWPGATHRGTWGVGVRHHCWIRCCCDDWPDEGGRVGIGESGPRVPRHHSHHHHWKGTKHRHCGRCCCLPLLLRRRCCRHRSRFGVATVAQRLHHHHPPPPVVPFLLPWTVGAGSGDDGAMQSDVFETFGGWNGADPGHLPRKECDGRRVPPPVVPVDSVIGIVVAVLRVPPPGIPWPPPVPQMPEQRRSVLLRDLRQTGAIRHRHHRRLHHSRGLHQP